MPLTDAEIRRDTLVIMGGKFKEVTVGDIKRFSGARSYKQIVTALESDPHNRFCVNVAKGLSSGGSYRRLKPGEYIVEVYPEIVKRVQDKDRRLDLCRKAVQDGFKKALYNVTGNLINEDDVCKELIEAIAKVRISAMNDARIEERKRCFKIIKANMGNIIGPSVLSLLSRKTR